MRPFRGYVRNAPKRIHVNVNGSQGSPPRANTLLPTTISIVTSGPFDKHEKLRSLPWQMIRVRLMCRLGGNPRLGCSLSA
ncbi:hypothetical protein Hypma_001897 [Hypsizygus marmoreus]|uniref:Uncharacterized protein n=1 Tax=Hypsizygus marmoreus TaxID=39966 RepID=A0A369JD16_HYPMA|nr:hypothetical protein Hypma_001897 [Hypsizygus marmoreus]